MKNHIYLLSAIFFLLPLTLLAAGTNFFSTYPDGSSLQDSDLFILERTGPQTIRLSGAEVSARYDAANAGATAATAATNGIGVPSQLSAFAPTNQFDAANAAHNATNAMSVSGSPLAAFVNTNRFASSNVATAAAAGIVKVDNSTITVAADGTISATTGGGGTVTSVNVAQQGYSSSGAVTTSGTVTLTQNADKNHLNFAETNMSKIGIGNWYSFTNALGLATTNVVTGANVTLLTTGALLIGPNAAATTNQLLDATTLGANHHVGTGPTTNLINQEDATGFTNTVAYTHDGTATNITATFNGTLQSFTITNGPDIFFGYAGANGSVSYRITTNSTLHFTYQPKWLAGSNSVITNGVLSLTSYGGTNATQLEAAMKENQ